MRILLTGAAGMVGRNVAEHPAMADHELLAPRRQQLDLSDAVAVSAYLRDHPVDMVIHAAGKVGGIQANMREPVGFLVDNLDIGRNVIGAARQAGVTRLLNLSSSCMYPRNRMEPLTEDMVLTGELEPTNEGYALAKIVALRLCEYISKQNPEFQYKTLIPCNLYGRFDKFDPSHSHLIPAIIHKVHLAKTQGLDAVEIWGDGTARREFMYAGDLADAILNAVDRFDSLPQVMNIGLGHDHTINEYYEAAARVMGYRGAFVHDTTKPVGMARKLVSVERQSEWGWTARHDLATGIAKTYEYYLAQQAS